MALDFCHRIIKLDILIVSLTIMEQKLYIICNRVDRKQDNV